MLAVVCEDIHNANGVTLNSAKDYWHLVDAGTQLMGFQVTKNAALLEWKQVMLQAMQNARQELCAAEGQTRLQVSTRTCASLELSAAVTTHSHA